VGMQDECNDVNAPVGMCLLKCTRSRTVVVLLLSIIGKSFLFVITPLDVLSWM